MDYNTYTAPVPISQAPTPDSGVIFMLATFYTLLALLIIAGMWKIFTKAGQAGWKCLIPIYNFYIVLQIVKKPGWWIILLFIPFVNIVILLLVSLDLAKSFGKSSLFGFFLLFLFSPIGYLVLGFGSSKYMASPTPTKADASSATPTPATEPTPPVTPEPTPAPTNK